MWDVEGGAGWGSCVDYLPGSTRPSNVKEGRSSSLQARSESLNLERKAETWEMWLLVRGGGGEVDISVKANFLGM